MTATAKSVTRESPYVGLVPFSEADASFFFGRNSEVEVVMANLRASPLTLLYGPSGVGKSSLLSAGVLYGMRKRARQNLKLKGTPEFAVALFDNWSGSPLKGLAESVHAALLEAQKIRALEPVPAPSFVKMIENNIERFGLKLLIILDQFEEYFLYRESGPDASKFADEFAEVVNRQDLPVQFLISLREDMISRLDYFKGRIPNLFDNRLVITRMDLEAAREAVTGPIDAYNTLIQPSPPYEIDPQLTSDVLTQVQRVDLEGTGRGTIPEGGKTTYIDTTYLQLVMTRIWKEEVAAGSSSLRAETLKKIGGATTIVQTHLDQVMKMLSINEQGIAARCFKYLVTPNGTKIALTVPVLAEWAELPKEKIAPVLEKLVAVSPPAKSGGAKDAADAEPARPQTTQSRILRPVEVKVAGSNEPQQGYEVWHDALIPAILDWQSRHLITFERKKNGLIGCAILLVTLGLVVWYGYNQSSSAQRVLQNVSEAFDSAKENLTQVEKEKEEVVESRKEYIEALNSARASASLVDALIKLRSSSVDERESGVRLLEQLERENQIPEELKPTFIKLLSELRTRDAEVVKNAIVKSSDRGPVEKIDQLDLAPRVYIHIQDEKQRDRAKEVQKILEENDYIVPGIENVGSKKILAPEVRYFRELDKELGNKARALLQQSGFLDVRLRLIPGFENSKSIRLKHFEVWFANPSLESAAAR